MKLPQPAHILAFFLLLFGCTGPNIPAPPAAPNAIAPVDVAKVCGQVKDIDQAALASAIAALPADSPIIAAMGDYKRMRDEARACQRAAQIEK